MLITLWPSVLLPAVDNETVSFDLAAAHTSCPKCGVVIDFVGGSAKPLVDKGLEPGYD